jgi:hypothetical protein
MSDNLQHPVESEALAGHLAEPPKPKRKLPISGDRFEMKHPFIREKHLYTDEEGSTEHNQWRPGVRATDNGPEGSTCEADGVGFQILTVVSLHKPGRYPARVFYTRRWRDPDGREFGKQKLYCKAVAAFTTLTGGYRYRVAFTASNPPGVCPTSPAVETDASRLKEGDL